MGRLLLPMLLCCFLVSKAHGQSVAKKSADDEILIDCHPETGASQENCEARGCVWVSRDPNGPPWCTYPDGYGYDLVDTTVNGSVSIFKLHRKDGQTPTVYGNDVTDINLRVEFLSQNILRLKFYDPNAQRYEVNLPTLNIPSSDVTDTSYEIQVTDDPQFGISVSRKSTYKTIFNTNLPGFIFSNQFLQISTTLPSENIYGFGENRHQQYKHDLNWQRWSMFTRDNGPVGNYSNYNLYGVQPFYLNIEEDGNANGVFLLNSNAMEIQLQPAPALTYRSIGGILDFFIFLGPTPENVVQQYTSLVGYPMLPPYWNLGFQLSRWGYADTNEMRTIIKNMRDNGLPYDVQYNDIDYMDSYRDFTLSKTNFADLPDVIQDLHDNGQHYICIVDNAIANTPTDSYPLTHGLAEDVFIKAADGTYLEGQVWPNNSYYPDYINPQTQNYWAEMLDYLYHDLNVQYDGIWIDMNEPSDFVTGSTSGCPDNSLNFPPYTCNVLSNSGLIEKTICMDAVHYDDQLHYNVHSLNGYYMSRNTFLGLRQNFPDKRPSVVTRSQYAGAGYYTTHWLGDNESTFDCLRDSIIGMLEYNLFGFPFVGADICGFNGNTYEELCIRWSQLGAFYPFSRNHNTQGATAQDPPSLGQRVVNANKKAFTEKYRLLPYLYTLLHNSHVNGGTVVRPLAHEFPTDANTWAIKTQFMWGSGLLISPVVTEGEVTVDAYFPTARWYDYYTGQELSEVGTTITLDCSLDDNIPLHVRGGTIIPTQVPDVNTVLSRQKPFGLIVPLDENGQASGTMFWDDGESFETEQSGLYNSYEYSVTDNTLEISFSNSGLGDTGNTLNTVAIYGLQEEPTTVTIDNVALDSNQVEYDSNYKVLNLVDLNLHIPGYHVIKF